MRILTVMALFWALNANATTIYIVDGKQVTAAEATKVSLTKPQTKILKIQANWVSLKQETMRLNKTSDASKEEIKQALK